MGAMNRAATKFATRRDRRKVGTGTTASCVPVHLQRWAPWPVRGRQQGLSGVNGRVWWGEGVVDLRAAVEQMDTRALHGHGEQTDAGVVADDDFTAF